MRLLDRYLLRELLLPLGYCLGGFLIFWISFDLLKDLDRFQEHGLNVADIIEFYLVTGPEFFLEAMPIGLLLALLYALTTHARHNELTAMRAAGISLWRFSAPYFAVGLFFSLTYFVINEFWIPDIPERAEAILNRGEGKRSNPMTEWRRDLKFLNSRDNRAWVIKAYNLKTSEMQKPVIDWNLPDGRRQIISAQRAIFQRAFGNFLTQHKTFTPRTKTFTTNRVVTNLLEMTDWSETPALIKSEIKISSLNTKQAAKRPQLSITDILNYLELHPRLDRTSRALIHTQLHGRIAAPWTCLVVVLIALPFGAPSGRRNVFVGVASSISICFSYFILLRLGLALGTGGYLPGWLAAWMPKYIVWLRGALVDDAGPVIR